MSYHRSYAKHVAPYGAGRHRVPTHHVRSTAAAIALALVGVAAMATPAKAAPVKPRPGEGVIAMTARTCGSSAGWRDVAAANRVTGPTYLIRLGHTYNVTCGTARPAQAQRATRSAPRAGWVLPLASFQRLSSCWGAGRNHKGIDMAAPTGRVVRAASAGVVTRAGWVWSGYGISVTIRHAGGVWTHYAHLSRERVSVGQRVTAGQQVGNVGSTGHSTGPHLHFEVARRAGILGSQINPAPYLRARGVRVGC